MRHCRCCQVGRPSPESRGACCAAPPALHTSHAADQQIIDPLDIEAGWPGDHVAQWAEEKINRPDRGHGSTHHAVSARAADRIE